MYIDRQVKDNCWNVYQSYGEICVGCGCCSEDINVRNPARIKVLEEMIENAEAFKKSCPTLPCGQIENINYNIENFKKKIEQYKAELNQ